MSGFRGFEEAAREAAGRGRPEPNFGAILECHVCREQVTDGYLDPETKRLTWWCSNDHESFIKDFPVFG